MSDNPNVGKVFNLTGGGGGNGSLKLESIAITKLPTKTTYKSGQSFDPTGMVVTASYGYGLTSDVTGYTVTPAILTDDVKEVTITYTEGRVTKTASTPVTVEKVLVAIKVTTPPTKITYNYLEKFQPNGMAVTAEFSDGSESAATGYSYPTTEFSTLGTQTINLDYTFEGVTKSTTLDVTVNPIEVPAPTQKDPISYNGTAKTPTWNGYDSVKMTLTGDTTGVNADTYTAKFTLVYGYVFPNGTREVSVDWVIQKAVIPAVPTQSIALAADGTPKSPTWDNYDVTQMTIGGDRFGTEPGDYTATFTPGANYQWWDGTTEPKDATWTITSVIVPIPTQKNIPTYDGSAKTPEWDNFDSENCSVQVTAATDAGDHTATFTLLQGMWADGTTAKKTVTWKINRATIPAVPAQVSIPTYDGNPKTPSWDSNYSAVKMTVSVEAKTNAGTDYTASFTPTANYQWPDGTIEAKSATWAINRASIPTLPSQSVALTYNGSEQSLTLKNYDSAKMTLGGTTKGTNAAEYTANVTPTSNYQWADGSITAKEVKWTIGKKAGTLTLTPASLTLKTGAKTGDFTISGEFDGGYTVESLDTSIATVALVSGKTYRVSSVNDTTGTTSIKVTCTGGSNYSAPAAKNVAITAQFTTIYGVEWDWTSSGLTKGTRTDAAAGFSDPNPAVNNGNGSSPFDNLMPWAGMVKETRAGGVEVKEPKYWFKWTKTGKKLKLQIADGPVEGFHVDPVNMDRGDGLGELDFSYIGRYHCATSTYKSETNKAQQVSITRSAARTAIHNLGANFWQMDFAQMWYVGMLFLVEFADWDGQKKIGRGCSASGSKENNGKTDAMQYHTGTTAANRDTYGYTQYRNIEGWWDNVYDWMDGCYYNSNGLNVIKNPNQFSDTANGTLIGSMPSGGYPNDMALPTQSGFEWALRPATTGGSDSTYVPDYWNFFGSYPCLFHGGNYSRYLDRGPFCVYCDGVSNASTSIGCRLQERPPKAA